MVLYSLGEDWEDEEKKVVAKRVLELSDAQTEELFDKVGISWTSSSDLVAFQMRRDRIKD